MQEMDDLYLSLGDKIREMRQSHGMTLEALAEKSGLGLGKASIVNIEKGRQQVTVYQLYRLANALGVQLEALLSSVREDNEWHWASKKTVLGKDDLKKFEDTFKRY